MQRNMVDSKSDPPTFHEGDEVVLATGSHQGTLGIFLRLKADVNWADITQRSGNVRSHPMEWLALAAGLGRGPSEIKSGANKL